MKLNNYLFSAKFYKLENELIMKSIYYHPYFLIKFILILISFLFIAAISYGATSGLFPVSIFSSIPEGATEIKGKLNINKEIDLFYENKKLDIENTKYL